MPHAPAPRLPPCCGRRCRCPAIQGKSPAPPCPPVETPPAGRRNWWRPRVQHSRSCEQPMHIPARMLSLPVVQSIAEHPETAAAHILQTIIIAGRPLVVTRPPPFRRDPLRPFEAGDVMHTPPPPEAAGRARSEEHTSELQSLMRNSYAVFCLKKKN